MNGETVKLAWGITLSYAGPSDIRIGRGVDIAAIAILVGEVRPRVSLDRKSERCRIVGRAALQVGIRGFAIIGETSADGLVEVGQRVADAVALVESVKRLKDVARGLTRINETFARHDDPRLGRLCLLSETEGGKKK